MLKRDLTLSAIVLWLLVLSACGATPAVTEENTTPPVAEQPAQEEIVPPTEVTIGHQTFSTDREELVLDIQIQSNKELDLSPLKWCSDLKNLTIHLAVTPHVSFDAEGKTVVSKMNAVDLSPLAELTRVEALRLAVGTVEDLAPLNRMPMLRELSLVIDGTADLSPLVDCAALQRLVLEGSGTVDLTPLSRCSELNYLRLWMCDENGETPELSALSGAAKLETLVVIGHNGLSGLKDVPLRKVQDIGDSASILEELPDVDTLETVQISDRFLTDISPLLTHVSVKQILLVVDGQELPQMTTITAENRELLDQLITAIPKEQLNEFLNRDGASVTIMFDMNRTSGFMVNHG